MFVSQNPTSKTKNVVRLVFKETLVSKFGMFITFTVELKQNNTVIKEACYSFNLPRTSLVHANLLIPVQLSFLVHSIV